MCIVSMAVDIVQACTRYSMIVITGRVCMCPEHGLYSWAMLLATGPIDMGGVFYSTHISGPCLCLTYQ